MVNLLHTFAGSQFLIYRSSFGSACIWDLDRQMEHGQMEVPADSELWGLNASHFGSFAAGFSIMDDGRNVLQLWHLHPFRCSAEIVRPKDD